MSYNSTVYNTIQIQTILTATIKRTCMRPNRTSSETRSPTPFGRARVVEFGLKSTRCRNKAQNYAVDTEL